MRALVFLLLLTWTPPLGLPARHQSSKSVQSKADDQSALRKEIIDKETQWASGVNSNDIKRVASLLVDDFTYVGSAQSDFDAMLFPTHERLSRSEYINRVTNSGVITMFASKEVRVTFDDSGRAVARFKLQVRVAPSPDPSTSDRNYRSIPKIQPGTYDVSDLWINTKEGWKAAQRTTTRLLDRGRFVPAG